MSAEEQENEGNPGETDSLTEASFSPTEEFARRVRSCPPHLRHEQGIVSVAR